MKSLKKGTSKICIDNTCADVPKTVANIMIGGAFVALLLHAITE